MEQLNFDTLSIDEGSRCMRYLLHPSPTSFVRVSLAEEPAAYLDKCHTNVRAEIWMLYSTKAPSPRGGRGAEERLQVRLSGDGCVCGVGDKGLEDLAWNLVVCDGALCLLKPVRGGAGSNQLKLLRGRAVPGEPCAGGVRGSTSGVRVVGYVLSYLRELEAIETLRQGYNRDFLRNVASPGVRDSAVWASEPFDGAVPSNEPQRDIVRGLRSRIECIQGPPGTGKSTTIYHILSAAVPPQCRAVVTCVQNKAIDSLVEKLAQSIDTLPFVVHGRPDRLGDCAARFTAGAQAARAPEVVRLQARVAALAACRRLLALRLCAVLARRCPAPPVTGRARTGRELWHAWWVAHARATHAALVHDVERYTALWGRHSALARTALGEAEGRFLGGARAFLSTVDSLGSLDVAVEDGRGLVVIIDEAGTVPESKLPLLLAKGASAIVAVGDQNQLQPFTLARDAQDGFFQRAVRALGSVRMLEVQYRMHPDIAALVSELFYGGRLSTDPGVADARRAAVGSGLYWLDYPDARAESDDAKRRCNAREVELISDFMHRRVPALLAQGKTVSIITFYKHQFHLLMDEGVAAGLVRTESETRDLKGKGEVGALTRFRHAGFRIATVDAAQGSEADVVVISCVRCNPRRDLGFVADRNRACVALSRARERLVVVGSARTVSGDPAWRLVQRTATACDRV